MISQYKLVCVCVKRTAKEVRKGGKWYNLPNYNSILLSSANSPKVEGKGCKDEDVFIQNAQKCFNCVGKNRRGSAEVSAGDLAQHTFYFC